MIKFLKKYINSILIVLGVILVLLSFSFLIFTRYNEKKQIQYVTMVVDQIKALLPDLSQGIPDKNANADDRMPMVDIDGTGYVGILQIQSLELMLPVSGMTAQYAYCVSGNAKAETLFIAGLGNEYKKILNISEGDNVLFTDIRGNVWRYRVKKIVRQSSDIPGSDEESGLILRVKSKDTFIFVYCVGVF